MSVLSDYWIVRLLQLLTDHISDLHCDIIKQTYFAGVQRRQEAGVQRGYQEEAPAGRQDRLPRGPRLGDVPGGRGGGGRGGAGVGLRIKSGHLTNPQVMTI